MAKWVMAQMGAFPQAYPQSVIDTVTTKHIRTLKEMRKRNWRSILKNANYGYGWRIYDVGDTELIYHGGSVAGFRSEIAYSTEKNLALVMLLNAETRMGGDLNAKFWTEVFTPEPKVTVAKVVKKPVPKRRVNIVTSIIPRDKPSSVPAL